MTYDDPSIALLDDPSLRGLPDPVCWQYARLLRLAGRCQAGGVLALAGRPLGVERLAQELGVELSELQVALRLLQGAGLVAQTEGAWMLPHMMYAAAKENWSLRGYWREKKRLSRSRVKARTGRGTGAKDSTAAAGKGAAIGKVYTSAQEHFTGDSSLDSPRAGCVPSLRSGQAAQTARNDMPDDLCHCELLYSAVRCSKWKKL